MRSGGLRSPAADSLAAGNTNSHSDGRGLCCCRLGVQPGCLFTHEPAMLLCLALLCLSLLPLLVRSCLGSCRLSFLRLSHRQQLCLVSLCTFTYQFLMVAPALPIDY